MVECTKASDEERVTFGEVVMNSMRRRRRALPRRSRAQRKDLFHPEWRIEARRPVTPSMSNRQRNSLHPASRRQFALSRAARSNIASSAAISCWPAASAITCRSPASALSITAAPGSATLNGSPVQIQARLRSALDVVCHPNSIFIASNGITSALPVSSRLFRLERIAGQPLEMPSSRRCPRRSRHASGSA